MTKSFLADLLLVLGFGFIVAAAWCFGRLAGLAATGGAFIVLGVLLELAVARGESSGKET